MKGGGLVTAPSRRQRDSPNKMLRYEIKVSLGKMPLQIKNRQVLIVS